MARKRSSNAKLRSTLYTVAKLLGNIRALQTGTFGKRVTRRIAGRTTGRILGKLFR